MHREMRVQGMDIQANDVEDLIGKKVRVYFNLHRKCWSIQDYKTRRVIGRSNFLKLSNVTFKVSEKGRLRVIKEKAKNVHAFAIGIVEDLTFPKTKDKAIGVTYNPYKHESFVTSLLEVPVYAAKVAWFLERSVSASIPTFKKDYMKVLEGS